MCVSNISTTYERIYYQFHVQSNAIILQTLAYLLLSSGSVGVGALMYIPSICKSATLSHAEYCSRSTLSVVLTLVTCIVFVMSAILSTFRFSLKTIGSP